MKLYHIRRTLIHPDFIFGIQRLMVLNRLDLCDTYIAGVAKGSAAILEDAMAHIRELVQKN